MHHRLFYEVIVGDKAFHAGGRWKQSSYAHPRVDARLRFLQNYKTVTKQIIQLASTSMAYKRLVQCRHTHKSTYLRVYQVIRSCQTRHISDISQMSR
jgi:hypothetical protein